MGTYCLTYSFTLYLVFLTQVEDHLLKEEDIMELILEKPLPNGMHLIKNRLNWFDHFILNTRVSPSCSFKQGA